MTTHTARWATAVLTLALLASATACSSSTTSASPGTEASQPSATAASPAPTPTPTPTATPTPSAATAEQLAISESTQMIYTYYRARSEALFDPAKTTTESLKSITAGTALLEEENALANVREQKYRLTGYPKVVSVHKTLVDLRDNKKANLIPTVEYLVCYDVSDVNILDSAGKSVVPATRVPRGIEKVGVANYAYPAADGWRVAYTQMQKGKTC